MMIHSLWNELQLPEDSVDRECAERCYDQCIADGFLKTDAVQFTKLTEHISPHLSEKRACARMHEIGMKYADYRAKITKVG